MLPTADTVYQEGDLLHLAVRAGELALVELTLDSTPAPSDN